MIASFRSEWLRLRRRPAAWILGAVLLAILLTLSYALIWIIFTFPPRTLTTPGTTPAAIKRTLYPGEWLHTVLSDTTGLGGAVALILGVVVAGSEYTWGTVKTMLTQGPGRLSVLAGKALTLEVAVLVLAVALLVAGAAASVILVTVDRQTSPWPDVVDVGKALGSAWLIMSMYAGLGFVLAVLFRQATLAVGIGLVYMLVVEGLVLGIFGGAEAFRPIVSAFPGSNAGSLIGSFPSTAARAAARPPVVGALQATVVMAAYTALFGVVSGAVFRARDVA